MTKEKNATASKPDTGGRENSCHSRSARHPEELKQEMIKRLRRIEGQIRGISKMIEDDVYCDDILHQIMAADSALSGVKKTLLKAHIKGCVADQLKNGEEGAIDELMITMTKMMK